jgi:hypothetical protein
MAEPVAELVFEGLVQAAGDVCAALARPATSTGLEHVGLWIRAFADRTAAGGLPAPSAAAYPQPTAHTPSVGAASVCPLTVPFGLGRIWIEPAWVGGDFAGTVGAGHLRTWLTAAARLPTLPCPDLRAFALAMPVNDRQFKSWKSGPIYSAILESLKSMRAGQGREALTDPAHPAAALIARPELELTPGQAVAVLANVLARVRDTHPHFKRLDVSEHKTADFPFEACRVWMWQL